ncbi:MAG: hypothetical protein ACM3SS_21080 [Rhodospirillaceae bacterium]
MSSLKPIRRLVAGNDVDGLSTVLIDGPAPNSHPSPTLPGCGHTDLWVWNDSPLELGGTSDEGNLEYAFPGEPRGGHLRVVQRAGRPPDYDRTKDPEASPFHPPKLRAGTTGTWERGGSDAYASTMHKTQTVDYGMMLNGARELILDEGRVLMQPGDIVIQVGAWHQWGYPLDGQMAFDMIGAEFPQGNGTAVGDDKPLEPAAPPSGIKLNRRIVTIDRPDGKSVIVSDGPSPDVLLDAARPGYASQRMWTTDSCPARIVYETLHLPRTLQPRHGGTTFRVDILPPDRTWRDKVTEHDVRDYFKRMGSPEACAWSADARHPYMQKTTTFDYCVVLEGELVLVLDKDEKTVRQGEVALLKGVRHAWSNRTAARAVLAVSTHEGGA